MVTSVEGHLAPVEKEEEHMGSAAVSWRSGCPMLPIALLPISKFDNLGESGAWSMLELSTDVRYFRLQWLPCFRLPSQGLLNSGRSHCLSLATVDPWPMPADLGRSWMNAGYWLQRTALGLALQAWATSRSGVKTFQLNSNYFKLLFDGRILLAMIEFSLKAFTPSICWMQKGAKGADPHAWRCARWATEAHRGLSSWPLVSEAPVACGIRDSGQYLLFKYLFLSSLAAATQMALQDPGCTPRLPYGLAHGWHSASATLVYIRCWRFKTGCELGIVWNLLTHVSV
jgi:hypothetical protein